MSFLSPEQESSVNQGMWRLHNQFVEPFYAYLSGQTTIISESPDHNSFYGGAPDNTETVTTFNSGLFFARTSYLNHSDNLNGLNFAGNTQELSATTANNILKIITDETGKSYLSDCERIEWSGEYWEKKSSPKRHGLLQKNFNTYYFSEIK